MQKMFNRSRRIYYQILNVSKKRWNLQEWKLHGLSVFAIWSEYVCDTRYKNNVKDYIMNKCEVKQ